MSTGWIKLHRKSLDHWLYNENRPHTKREAWEDLLLLCNNEENKVLIRGELIDCKRGQSVMSLKSWANTFKWSIQQVRTFFNLLEKDSMITIEGLKYSTRITVCNYGIYQDRQQTDNKLTTSSKQTDNILLTTNKNNKEEKNNITIIFEDFRKKYPGTKRGLKTELENFLKKNNPETTELLLPALQKEMAHKEKLKSSNQFCPEWKNLSTWINKKCWEQDFPTEQNTLNGKRQLKPLER